MSDDATERLRRKAQNEQTAIGLSELLRLEKADNERLRGLLRDEEAARTNLWGVIERLIAVIRGVHGNYLNDRITAAMGQVTPNQPQSARCDKCKAELEQIRPGIYRHPGGDCATDKSAAAITSPAALPQRQL